MRRSLAFAFLSMFAPSTAADEPAIQRGIARFAASDDPKCIPERYRLQDHEFPWEMTRKRELPLAEVEVFDVRFPSPVTTKHPENNTVHAEYYRPKKDGPFPCVIVLDITGGDQSLSRTIA